MSSTRSAALFLLPFLRAALSTTYPPVGIGAAHTWTKSASTWGGQMTTFKASSADPNCAGNWSVYTISNWKGNTGSFTWDSASESPSAGAFDRTVGTPSLTTSMWITATHQPGNSGPDGGVELAFGAPCSFTLTHYTIKARGDHSDGTTQSPSKMTVYGSNDASSWIEIGSFSNQTTWAVGEEKTFPATAGGAYAWFLFRGHRVAQTSPAPMSVSDIWVHPLVGDECAGGGGHNCHANAACLDTFFSFTCACNGGFSGDGIVCTNINECSTGAHNCHSNATCTDQVPYFGCACNGGFSGDGVTCANIDECSTGAHNCHSNATCTDEAPFWSCACNGGFSGDGVTCTNINECSTGAHNCHSNATCTDQVPYFGCACNGGFSGDGVTCANINECSTGAHNCHSNATCTDEAPYWSCACNGGFSGDGVACSNINECSTGAHNCHSNATCTDQLPFWSCACNGGFSGDGVSCANINECSTGAHNCHSNATCSDEAPFWSCACNGGFSGDGVTCTNINECSTGAHNCHSNATCTDQVPYFGCACSGGFSGDGVTCANINECSTGAHNCHSNATCTDEAPFWSCACNGGFSGDGVSSCSDIDECSSGTHNCHSNANCTKQVPYFNCACDGGFSGDGVTCSNINECSTGAHNCHSNATCTDQVPYFGCACNGGFSGNGVSSCSDIDECFTGAHNCAPEANCTNQVPFWDCVCDHGYSWNGTACAGIDECSTGAHNCDANAACTDQSPFWACACNGGYSGDGFSCSDIDECSTGAHNCAPEANCTNQVPFWDCVCDHGYSWNGTACAAAECHPDDSQPNAGVCDFGCTDWTRQHLLSLVSRPGKEPTGTTSLWSYTCFSGFQLDQADRVWGVNVVDDVNFTCTGTGPGTSEWQLGGGTMASCSAVACNETTDSGTFSPNSFDFSRGFRVNFGQTGQTFNTATFRFGCFDGFGLKSFGSNRAQNSSFTGTCTARAYGRSEWTIAFFPTCEPANCNQASDPQPNALTAQVIRTNTPTGSTNAARDFVYSCNDGCQLVGPGSVNFRCTALAYRSSEWQGGELPNCTDVSCNESTDPQPNTLTAEVVRTNSGQTGNTTQTAAFNYSCNDGYSLNSPVSSVIFTCTGTAYAQSQWQGSPPTCSAASCNQAIDPQPNALTAEVVRTDSAQAGVTSQTAAFSYSCNDGYQRVGSGSVVFTCTGTAYGSSEWQGGSVPTCSAVSCNEATDPQPNTLAAEVVRTDSGQAGVTTQTAVFTYTCNDGYALDTPENAVNFTCTGTANAASAWQGSPPTCSDGPHATARPERQGTLADSVR
uniref:Uncharacterized protein n=1 Tax=Chromera velia CCMP2878 TaxID=1169474 RepID=A0A0G4FTX7_9ALVE|eukprot:Cvel_18631.t1-p1 / transcript=Cvel_18631.t1 / gene=Cvel_18631 / organism=Chromera_velia_CCMP2878 / gene_product=Fibrillin-1, putative / transcript_product=Fibrillin-1, putative / location=Cvel_scaffold1556:6448-18642(+) / protein_length=1299 / sequence_SO=supercontig / SO=protein_coding / is_pseudo=false